MALSRAEYLDIYRRHLVDDVVAWWLARAPTIARRRLLLLEQRRRAPRLARQVHLVAGAMGMADGALRASLPAGPAIEIDEKQCRRAGQRTAIFMRDRLVLPGRIDDLCRRRAGEPKSAAAGARLPHQHLRRSLRCARLRRRLRPRAARTSGASAAEAMLASAWERIRSGPVPTEPYPIPAGFKCFDLPMILVGRRSRGASGHGFAGFGRLRALGCLSRSRAFFCRRRYRRIRS